MTSSHVSYFHYIDVTMVGQIQARQQSLLMCLDLPYRCDVNTHIVQPQ